MCRHYYTDHHSLNLLKELVNFLRTINKISSIKKKEKDRRKNELQSSKHMIHFRVKRNT